MVTTLLYDRWYLIHVKILDIVIWIFKFENLQGDIINWNFKFLTKWSCILCNDKIKAANETTTNFWEMLENFKNYFWSSCCIVKILNLFIILLCSHLYHTSYRYICFLISLLALPTLIAIPRPTSSGWQAGRVVQGRR